MEEASNKEEIEGKLGMKENQREEAEIWDSDSLIPVDC